MHKSRMADLPVLIVGFARTEQIWATFNKLIDFGVKRIFISLDYSPKGEIQTSQNLLMSKVNLIAKQIGLDVRIWRRSRNHGVAVAVITALDWFFHYNENGVVIEDDLVFEEDFLQFSLLCLEKYKEDQEVLLISGNRFEVTGKGGFVSATNYPQIWGWASWRAKWQNIREGILKFHRLDLLNIFDPAISFFYVGAKRAQNGMVDTWDLPLAYYMYANRLLCILPPVNLVSNIGNDEFSKHTKNSDFPMNFPLRELKEFNLLEASDLQKKTRRTNQFLENCVFGIRKRHMLTPIKFAIQSRCGKSNQNLKPLTVKLTLAETFV